jgi:hypothetical protein
MTLRTMWLTAPQDHFFDLGSADLRRFLQHMPNAMSGKIVRSRQVERTSMRLGQRRPAASDDDGFSHMDILPTQPLPPFQPFPP